MPRRQEPLVAGRFYHIYNRGHNRQPIFQSPNDYGLFLRKYRQYVCPEHAVTLAYVLMPNHFHMLVKAATDGLSHAMQLFAISFAKIVNRERDRVGALFQGPFQAKAVEYDEYLLHLTGYTHLNPVRAGLVSCPEEWAYSSCPEYLGLRSGSLPETEMVFKLLDSYQIAGRSRQEKYSRFHFEMADRYLSTSEVETGLRKSVAAPRSAPRTPPRR
ncbi:MAG: transposase [Gemmataceae bacterium]|nr:transposase [Gemmataceae bacterium]